MTIVIRASNTPDFRGFAQSGLENEMPQFGTAVFGFGG